MLSLPGGLVWIASYPKSGNTWMRILLSNLLAGLDGPEDINNLTLSAEIAGSRALFEDQTLIDSHLLRAGEIEALRPAVHDAYAASRSSATFSKVHDAWTCLPDGRPQLGRLARAALYIVRDPRDVAVSYAAFQGCSVDKAITQMDSADEFLGPSNAQLRQHLGDWSAHVRGWLDQTMVPVHLLRYEDLLADTAGEFRRALAFLGAQSSGDAQALDPAIARAVRHADFGELRRQEQAQGFRERSLRQRALGHDFFRQGRSGAWREQLSQEQAGRIESAHAATMAGLGYELTTQQESTA
jgi:aryl sulfotransferase